jgi:5-oxoprolinase (ATP-hydrolysing)
MANTCTIDPKVLEKYIPMLIRNVSLRKGSGGDSVICVFKPESYIPFAMGNKRYWDRPYSLKGGKDGYASRNLARINHPTGKRFVNISPRGSITLQGGEQL